MSLLYIKKSMALQGQVTPPSSKSHSIRAIILATLSCGGSILTNILHSDDTRDAIVACKQLGACITESSGALIVNNNGLPLSILDTEINCGNSGVTTHCIMPILGLRQNTNQPIILNCGTQMRARPIKSLVDALNQLGLDIQYIENTNTLPVRITKKLMGGKVLLDGISSQHLSALLIALPCAQQDSEIIVKNLSSRPYADMTLNYLKEQGIQFRHKISSEIDVFYIKGGQKYHAFNTEIPGDFSSASYLIAASALIPGEVILDGLSMTDLQGDKELVTILKKMGADITIEPRRLIIRGGKKLTGIKIDANMIPDLLPTLAVIGTYAMGKTEIINCKHARIKETDRIHSMSEGLKKLGAKIAEKKDGLVIYESKLVGNHVKGYGDHRTVMALCVAGMIADGATIIDDAEAIDKTFPTFVKIMQSIGAKIRL